MGEAYNSSKGLQGPSILEEWPNVLLLVILYMVQGIPLGLSMGSMPFLMRSTMSYTKIGIFTLAAYPYSFKLLWSPIIDTVYFRSIGRRKSWILPLQTIAALIMILCGGWAESKLAAGDAVSVTAMFFVLVLLAATQDIAVDGWALTLLSKKNVGFAATCQTVGMNIGYFSSFTVFLALSDPDFCGRFLGSASGTSVITLQGYLKISGWVYLAVTAGVAILKKEKMPISQGKKKELLTNGHNFSEGSARKNRSSLPETNASTPERRRSARLAGQAARVDDISNGHQQLDNEMSEAVQDDDIRAAYTQLFRVVHLPAVRTLALVLFVARIGMLPAESAAALKLLEKGVSKEALAGLVLIEFPVELFSAVIAGRWAASAHPLRPYFSGYRLRLVLAACTTAIVYFFPPGVSSLKDAPLAFSVLAASGIATSFSSTLMFTALGDFYNRISDPAMGGAYLTLLNTLANVGVVVPKLGLFAAIDALTVRRCSADKAVGWLDAECGPASAAGASDGACLEAGGSCVIVRDGFYVLSVVAVVSGIGIAFYLTAALRRLEKLPIAAWRAPIKSGRTK